MNYEKLAGYINRELARCMKESSQRLDRRREYYRAVRRLIKCAIDISSCTNLKYDSVTLQVMNDLKLHDFDSLQRWAGEVANTANILVNLQAGNYQAVSSADYEKLNRLHKNVPVLTLLAVMNEFAYKCGRDFPVKSSLLALLEVLSPLDRKGLYTTILESLLPDTTTNELGELRADLAVIDVLSRMNSKDAGMLIDQFAKSEQTLKQLSSAGYTIPPELASVPLCVRLFMQTMRNVFTVSPLHTIGETLTLTLEDAANYDYTGSDFEDSDEAKTVRVISPGWKCGDEVFSMPKVIEVSSNAR